MTDYEKILKLADKGEYVSFAAAAIALKEQWKALQLLDEIGLNEWEVEKYLVAYEMLLLANAQTNFDCYCRYIDFDKRPVRNFYATRRQYLKPFVDALQELEQYKDPKDLRIVRMKAPTGIGKSSLVSRLMFWTEGRRPYGEILYGVGGGALANAIYDKNIEFMDEYWERHNSIFPDMRIVKTSIEERGIWFRESEYPQIAIVSAGGNYEGRTQGSNGGILDDIVSIEEAGSAQRMDDLYVKNIDKFFVYRRLYRWILCIGTPVAENEPLDRLFEDKIKAGWKGKEVKVPMLDENGESNFEFKRYISDTEYSWQNTTEELQKYVESIKDNPEKYANFMTRMQCEPTVPGGYRFQGVKEYEGLPDGKYKEYVNFDPADKGTDAAVVWEARVYDNDPEKIYFVSAFFDSRPMEEYLEELCLWLKVRDINLLEFEDNMGGTLLAKTLEEKLRSLGHMCTVKPYSQHKNKKQRINAFGAELLDRALFRKDGDKSYGDALAQLKTYTDKSEHDDAIDCAVRIVERVLKDGSKKDLYGKFDFSRGG
jgi:predicted phage terminase large subunit-like protein